MRLEVAPAEVQVVPGEHAIVVAQVFNTDDVINAYAVRVFGVDPTWVRYDEERLSLFPGATGLVTVTIDVPRSYPAGELRVGIEVTPIVDPGRGQVGESILVVPPHRRATMSLDPMMQAGGKRALFNVTLTNEGNTPISLALGCSDPEDKVRVAFQPPVVELQPKQQVIVPARAQGKRPIWGNPAPRTLTFTASGADNPLESFGSFIQRPVLARGLMSLFGLLFAASIFALVLTSTLGKVVDVAKVDSRILERAVNGDPSDRGVIVNPGTASGTVTLLTSGTGVSGVTVELFPSDDPTTAVASAATSEDGEYRLTGLDQGVYKLRLRGAGFVEIWYGGGVTFDVAQEIEIALGEVTAGLDVALGGVPGSIAGKVIGLDPADAVVTLQLPAATLGSASDAQVAQVLAGGDGTFLLEKVPAPASYELVVSKEGFATEKRVVNLAAAETKENVEVPLRKGDGLISGTVSSGGEALGGVTVTASNTTNESSTISLTNGDVGGYTLRNLPTPATYTLSFTREGYGVENLTLNLARGDQLTGMDISLAKGTGSISGTVTRQGAGPVGGVVVTVSVPDGTIKTETLSVGDVGSYLLSGLPAPGTYTVSFSGSGLASQVRSVNLETGSGANLEGVNATMTSATAQIGGIVSDESGPADDVSVVVSNGTDTWKTRSATAPAGQYLITSIAPGTYTVTFSRDGSESRSVLVSVVAGENRTVSLTLAPRASISGTVSLQTSSGTTLLSGATVVAYRIAQYPTTVAAQTVTDAQGKYVLANLSAPETYIIEFLPPDAAVAAASRQIALGGSEQRTGVDVVLDPE